MGTRVFNGACNLVKVPTDREITTSAIFFGRFISLFYLGASLQDGYTKARRETAENIAEGKARSLFHLQKRTLRSL